MVYNITKFGRGFIGMLLAVLLLGSASVYAGNEGGGDTNNADKLRAHCKTVAAKDSKAAAKACDDNSLIDMNHPLNAATYHCADKSEQNNAKTNCVLAQAKKYFDKVGAMTPKATTANGFAVRLDRVLSDDVAITGGSINVAEESAGSLAPDVSSTAKPDGTVDPAACAANPKIKGCGSDPNAACTRNSCDLVAKYINPAISMLTVTFGLFAVISLIMGGIQYSASNGDSQKVSNAKKRIIMTLEAIVAYAFLWGFLQFLVPGGVF